MKLLRVFGGSGSRWAKPFSLWSVCCLHHRISCRLSFFFVCWFAVDRLLLLRDRESVSNCNFVWRDLVFLSCTRVEGYPSDLVLKSSGPITFDSRSGVSSFAQVLVLGFLWFLSVHRRSRGGGSWMVFRLGVFRKWFSFGVQDRGFIF